jgi:hypothetical protein
MPVYMIIYLGIIVLGIIVGAINFSKLTKSSRCFWLLLVITFLAEIMAWFAFYLYQTNMIVYRIFAFIQYALLARGFGMELPSYNRLINGSILFIFLFGIFDLVTHTNFIFIQYHTSFKTIINLFIVGLTLVYLRAMLVTEVSHSFFQFPLFWMSIGWMVFSIITLFNFSAYNFINQKAHSFLELFQEIRIVTNYFLYGLFIIAFVTKQHSLSIP